jgi:hypothetical protein
VRCSVVIVNQDRLRHVFLLTTSLGELTTLWPRQAGFSASQKRNLYETDPSTWLGAAAFTSVIQPLLKKGPPPAVVEALANLFRLSPNRPLLLDRLEHFASTEAGQWLVSYAHFFHLKMKRLTSVSSSVNMYWAPLGDHY